MKGHLLFILSCILLFSFGAQAAPTTSGLSFNDGLSSRYIITIHRINPTVFSHDRTIFLNEISNGNDLKTINLFIIIDSTIQGTVIDSATGEPLVGATVIVKGHTTGTTTDSKGHFILKAPSNAILEVSYLGYGKKEIPINGKTTITILLAASTTGLNQLVVVGYSEKRKSELTSAVTVVDSKKLNDVTSNDIGSLLQGKAAGLYAVNSSGVPGASAELRLRGISSINASQSPIFVVDGIIGGNFDPNDVASVTVLKDAAATAMYGSQANGGVIVITTKNATSNKLTVEAKFSTGVRYPDFGKMTMMTGSQLYNYQKELYRDYIPGDTNNSYKIDLLRFYADRPRYLDSTNFNWLKAMFKPALIQNYHVSLAGKAKNNDYYFGISFYNEDGTFVNTNYKRINILGKSTVYFGKSSSLTNNISLSGDVGKSYDYNDIYYAYLNLPWDNPFDSSGKPIYVDQSSPFKWWSRDKINPLNTAENSDHRYKGFDVNYDLDLNLRITDWLRFSSTNRVAASYNTSSNYYSPEVAGQYHGKGFLDGSGELDYGGVFNNLLKFSFTFGRNQLSGLAGVAYQIDKFQSMGGSGRGLPFDLKVFNVVSSNLTLSGFNSESEILSYLSQINYIYENKYFLTASFREDGSTAFPKTKRYGLFPAISAAWLISNESFLQNSKTISNLKIRGSYGVTGTQDIGASRYLGLFSLSSQYNGFSAAIPLQLPSPDLTWESKYQLDIGMDMELFQRVSLTLDYYNNITKNLLLQVSQPTSVGFENRWENVGQIVNKGLEVTISSTNINNNYFIWRTDFNISFNSNKLRGLPAPFVKTDSWGNSQIYQNGGSLYEFYLPVWKGVDPATGAPLWEKVIKDSLGNVKKSTTSKYADATLEPVGSAVPNFQGGMTNTFSYKNFSLSVNAFFVHGDKVYSNILRFTMNDGNEPLYNQIVLPKGYNIWTHPGDHATNPSPQNAANSTAPSTRYLLDGSFIQLRNISLSYSARSLAKALHIEDLVFTLSADNIYTITNFIGQDPQVTITPQDYNMPGVNDFKYPNNHQYLFTIWFKF